MKAGGLCRNQIDQENKSNRCATGKWKPTGYPVGRLVIAPRRLLARAVVHAYKHCWPCVRRLRRTTSR